MKRVLSLAFPILGLVLFFSFKLEAYELKEPELYARSAILLEASSGTVIYEKNADLSIPPASLTKLMTLHLIYQKLKEGKIHKTDPVPITRNAWALSLPRHTSRMFLEPGQQVTVSELMQGLSIVSGNDAAIALAEYVSGSVDRFVEEMNREAERLGFPNLKFKDTSGISPENRITAREFARFCRIYLSEHPEALEELHSRKTFVYPKPGNLNPRGKKRRHSIVQHNRNSFLGKYPGVDGLKTGYIKESGFNISISAKKDNMRLIAVILGVFGKNPRDGSRKREIDGQNLLHYGFHHYVTLTPVLPKLPQVRIWKGKESFVGLRPAGENKITLRADEARFLKNKVVIAKNIDAPVKKDQVLGHIIFYSKTREVGRFDLTAEKLVEAGGFFRKLWDGILMTALALLNWIGLA